MPMQPKIQKNYQISLINENFEPGKQDVFVGPVFYNVYHELSSNDE